jgi:3-oxoacyl-[acyl-carrier-protein] synthase III
MKIRRSLEPGTSKIQVIASLDAMSHAVEKTQLTNQSIDVIIITTTTTKIILLTDSI